MLCVNVIKRGAAWADDVRLGKDVSLWDLERVSFTSSQVAIKNTVVHNECPLHPRLDKYWILFYIIFYIISQYKKDYCLQCLDK